ncbi:hypothetical protein BGX23_008947 [Mortierella sp. AD031]|nr:hypothetical protein BGX23_008947 [Mortierella sp. AD031]
MSSSRAFKDAANLAGSNLTRIHMARPSTTLHHVRISTTTHLRHSSPLTSSRRAATRGYATISTNTNTPSTFDQTAGLTPGARAIIATARGARNILIVATSVLSLGYFVFAGTHAYLEQYKCPSPSGVSQEVQRCLHGAWVREEISPDPDIAEVYFQKALEIARKDLETYYKNQKKNGEGRANSSDERLRFLEVEKDQGLVEIQNQLARFYGRTGRDEQAATIWTRLWKLSEKEDPRLGHEQSSSTLGPGLRGLGSWFGGASGERPLITQKDGLSYAKSAADCWMRMGEYDMAEEALAWTMSTLASTTTTTSADPQAPSSASTSTSASRIEEIGLLSTLGALYVRQAKFEYALSLFVKALQAVQEHRAQTENNSIGAGVGALGVDATTVKENKDMWYCREAILTQSIGETLYGAATRSSSSAPSSTSSPATKAITATTATPSEPKKSSWKFWSSSSSSSSSSSTSTPSVKPTVVSQKSPEQIKKEEEALGWMQKALTMAKAKSGEHRDCDECAALGLNNLGLINEMEGKRDVALAQFREAVLHATIAKDYVGIDDYNRNIVRLTDQIDSDSQPTSSTSA